MDILILGGTAWLGRAIAAESLKRGHRVTALARGEAGAVADGAELIRADRSGSDPYAAIADRDWDAVFEVSWQPGFVRGAVEAIGQRAGHWTYISSISAYVDGAAHDESGELLPALESDTADRSEYGSAKAACEQISAAELGMRLLIVRPGIIGGPGDHTDRTGYWVARSARDGSSPMLVPDALEQPTQVIDVRDLVTWLVDSAEQTLSGVFDAVGPRLDFAHWVDLAREVGGHEGSVVTVPSEWLAERGVTAWSSPASLPFWMPDPADAGAMSRSGAAAADAGLVQRSRRDMVEATLQWERDAGLDRPRAAGISADREAALLAEYLAG